jgi:ABC-type nitrate/sulfonate/bicarbonate transport system substrate-binding protein
MKDTVRRALCFLRFLFSAGYLPRAANEVWSADTPQRVRIAYATRSSSAMPLYMALQKGYFKAEGR